MLSVKNPKLVTCALSFFAVFKVIQNCKFGVYRSATRALDQNHMICKSAAIAYDLAGRRSTLFVGLKRSMVVTGRHMVVTGRHMLVPAELAPLAAMWPGSTSVLATSAAGLKQLK